MGAGANQIIRPQDCPSCKQNRPNESCGILTLSASQLGAVLGLVIGAVLYLFRIFQDTNGTSIAPAAVEHEDIALSEYFWAILLISALYYAVAEWVLEERDYLTLRSLPLAVFEFWLRVGLAVLFGVAVAGAPEALSFSLSSLHASFFILCMIYIGFLFWDVIVAGGGQGNLVRRVVWFDFGGLMLILLCLWTHALFPTAVPFIILFAFGVVLVKFALLFAFKDYNHERFWKRSLQR
jgi:hypothetical protein